MNGRRDAQFRLPLRALPADADVCGLGWHRPTIDHRTRRPAAFGDTVARHRVWFDEMHPALPARAALASCAGTSVGDLAEIEYGNLPTLARGFALADALGVDLAELVYETEQQAAGAAAPTRPPRVRVHPAPALVAGRGRALGEIIARIRTDRGLGPADLAHVTALRTSTILRIEDGQLPTLGQLFDLADALRSAPDHLLHETRHHANISRSRWTRRPDRSPSGRPAGGGWLRR